uniref:cGMP-dependent protein kinase 1, alpha isozyme n=1 Tax=Magallana gigas TaxID=29159 RepID=K1RGS7_MAGGI
MGSLQELQALIRSKDEKIRELQKKIHDRDDVITQLRSQLDKYQSVLPQSLKVTARPRKQRAQGISAEPHSPKDLVKANNKKHSKSER